MQETPDLIVGVRLLMVRLTALHFTVCKLCCRVRVKAVSRGTTFVGIERSAAIVCRPNNILHTLHLIKGLRLGGGVLLERSCSRYRSTYAKSR